MRGRRFVNVTPTAELSLVRSAFNLSRTPPSVRTAAPVSGEHTRAVLEELGLDGDEIDALANENVIPRAP